MTPVYWHLDRGLRTPPSPEDWLSAGELVVLAGLRFEKRRNDWLRGRWTSKRLLAPLLGVAEPRRLAIVAASDGAPEVWLDDSHAGWTLSLSHTGDDALAMAAEGKVALGCDVETVAPRTWGLEADYYTKAEQAWVAEHTGELRDLATNLIWSAKESALKALRVGLSRDTRTIEVRVGGDGTEELVTGPLAGPVVAWSPLFVRGLSDASSLCGWWRRDGARVVSMVMRPRPSQPVAPEA